MISFKLLVFAALVAVTLSHHLHHTGRLLTRVVGNHPHEVHSRKRALVNIEDSAVEDRENEERSGIEEKSGLHSDSGERQHISRRKIVIASRDDSGNDNNNVVRKALRVTGNGFGNLKRRALYSIGFLGQGIEEKHRAFSIFKQLSTRSKASSIGDVLDVYLTGAFGAGEIIDSWVPGLGKLFSLVALASAKINFCLGDSTLRSSRPGTICSHKYGRNWGLNTERETSFNSAKDYITAYGLDDGLIKFKKLLRTHAKVDLSSLTGSQRIVAQAIFDLFQNGRFSHNYSWSKKDVSFVFSRVITILAALGSSYHRNIGPIIIEDLCDYSSEFGNEHNGLKLSDLKDQIRKSIENVKSNRWKNVIKTCSDDDYRKIAEEQDSDNSDDYELNSGSNTSPQNKRKPNTPKIDDDDDDNKRHDVSKKKNKVSDTDDDIDDETIKKNNDGNKKSKPKNVNKTDNDDDDSDDKNDEPDSPKKTKTNDEGKQKAPKAKKPEQKPLFSFRIFWKAIKGDHKASQIFRNLSRKPKPTNVGDVLDVYLTGAYGAGTIIDTWAPGLGKLFTSLAIVSTKINYCSNNGVFRVPSSLLGSICTDKYGNEWGFKPTQQISASRKPRDYIIAYGLDDSLAKFRTLLKTHVKTDLSSLSGSQKIVAQAIHDILENGRFNPDYTWSKNDVSFVFSKVITILAALGSSYHKNVGITIVDNLLDYSSNIGDNSNGLVLISLNNEIKKAIASANSHRWQLVIKECSDEQYNNQVNKKNNDDDDDDNDFEDSPRGPGNGNDKRDDGTNPEKNKDVKHENNDVKKDGKDKKNHKNDKKPNKEVKKEPSKDSPKDNDNDDVDDDQYNSEENKNVDDENNDVKKDGKDKKNHKNDKKPNKEVKKEPSKDSPKDNDNDDVDDDQYTSGNDKNNTEDNDKRKKGKNDSKKKNKDNKDDTTVDKDTTDKKGRPADKKQPDNKGKRKPLFSLTIFSKGIKKDHGAYYIFRSLSKKSKPSKVGDVLDVYLAGAFGAGAIIDSWAPGLGKLFSTLAIASTKINYCSSNGIFKVPSSHLGSICSAKYGSNWGFKPDREVPASNKPKDYIIAYGLDGGLAKFRTLLKTHVKVELSSLSGSQKIVAQAIYDILQNGRFNPDYIWSKKDVSLVFSKVITILATLGSSYHKNVGTTIIDDLLDYSTDIGNDSNGLDLISLKNDIKSAIVSANSHRWQQVIKECSEAQYDKHVKEQDNDDDDDDDDDDTDKISQGQKDSDNNTDDKTNSGNTKDNEDDTDKEVKKDEKNNKDTSKQNQDDKKGTKKDSPRNDSDKEDAKDKNKDVKNDKKDNKQNKDDKGDTNSKSPVGKDSKDKKPENDKPTDKKGKRKPLFSFRIFWEGIKKDHGASSIFKKLSNKPKPANLGDVLDVYLSGAFGAGTIIDSWAPGLGKLFSSLAIVSAKINYCSSNAPFKVPSSKLGSICTDKYGSNWGFKPDRNVPASKKPRDYIIAYGLDGGLTKFRTLLKTHVKTDLSNLSGSQKIVGQAIYDILQDGRFSVDYSWSKKDVSFVFSKVITVLAALGSSYHKNLGPTIVENLFDYSSDIGKDSGLDLTSLKNEIKKAIESANSQKWQQVIKECSDDQYDNHIKKQDNDDDDDDTEESSQDRNDNNNKGDDDNNTKKDKNIKDDTVKKDVTNDDRKNVKKDNKKGDKDNYKNNQDGKVNTDKDSSGDSKNNEKAVVDTTSRNNKSNTKDKKNDEGKNKEIKDDKKGAKKDISRVDDDDDDNNDDDGYTSENKEKRSDQTNTNKDNGIKDGKKKEEDGDRNVTDKNDKKDASKQTNDGKDDISENTDDDDNDDDGYTSGNENKNDQTNTNKNKVIKDGEKNEEDGDRNVDDKNDKKDASKQTNDNKKNIYDNTDDNDDDDDNDEDGYTSGNKENKNDQTNTDKDDKLKDNKKDEIKDHKKQKVDSGRSVEVTKDKDAKKQNKGNEKDTKKNSSVGNDTTGKKDKPEADKKPDSKKNPDSKTTKDNQPALASLGIFWQRIKGGHRASVIFKTLATKPKSTKVADVLDVYLTGTFGAGAIIDSWVSGLGKLFSSLVLASIKINYCLENSVFSSLSSKIGPICSDEYGSNWGFKVENEVSSYEDASDYINAFGLDDGLVTFKRLLKTYTKSDDLSDLVGSQKVVVQAIRDLFENDRFSPDYSWTKKDVSFVFSKVITVLGALGSSYSPDFGPSLVDELLDYSSQTGDDSNGLVLIDLRQKIKKTIATCQSQSWNDVIIFGSDDNKTNEVTKDKPKKKEDNPNNKDLNEGNNSNNDNDNKESKKDKNGNKNKKITVSDDYDEDVKENGTADDDETNKNIEKQDSINSDQGNYRTAAGRKRSTNFSEDDDTQSRKASSIRDTKGSKSSDQSENKKSSQHAFKQSHHSQESSASADASSYRKSYKNKNSEGNVSGSKGLSQSNHSEDGGFESGTWNEDGSKTSRKNSFKENASNKDTFQKEKKRVKNGNGSSYEESSSQYSSSSSSSSRSSRSEYTSY